MENFRYINGMYDSMYADLDKAEKSGADTIAMRLKLRQNHVTDLTENIEEFMQACNKSSNNMTTNDSDVTQMCAHIKCLEKELKDADEIIAKLKCEIQEVAREAKIMDAELAQVVKCLEASERERSMLNTKVSKTEQSIECYKEEVKTLVEVNDKCQKDLVSTKDELRRKTMELTSMSGKHDGLKNKVEELEHRLVVYKETLKKEESVVELKEELIERLCEDLDDAQERIIMWQVKAIAGDDAFLELKCMNNKLQALVPELEEVCNSNVELNSYTECLKQCLEKAHREIECLRQKIYIVACEAAELDSKLTKVTEQAQRANKTANQRGNQRGNQRVKNSVNKKGSDTSQYSS